MAELFRLMTMPAVIYALAAGIMVSICAALLGVVLVLKNYSLIGHGLADTAFASLSLALALGLPPLAVSFPVVMIAAFAIMMISQKRGVAGDAAIGVASTGALAAGILITAATNGFNMDVYGYMFGSIVALGKTDVYMAVGLLIAVAGLFALLYNRIFIVTMDESFARALGINVTLYQFIISALTALCVVVGMRLMGTLLISSLIIFPVMTMRKVARSFGGLALGSALTSVICFVLGLCASVVWNVPTGAGIVAMNITAMVMVSVFAAVLRRTGRQ